MFFPLSSSFTTRKLKGKLEVDIVIINHYEWQFGEVKIKRINWQIKFRLIFVKWRVTKTDTVSLLKIDVEEEIFLAKRETKEISSWLRGCPVVFNYRVQSMSLGKARSMVTFMSFFMFNSLLVSTVVRAKVLERREKRRKYQCEEGTLEVLATYLDVHYSFAWPRVLVIVLSTFHPSDSFIWNL